MSGMTLRITFTLKGENPYRYDHEGERECSKNNNCSLNSGIPQNKLKLHYLK